MLTSNHDDDELSKAEEIPVGNAKNHTKRVQVDGYFCMMSNCITTQVEALLSVLARRKSFLGYVIQIRGK